MKSFFCVNRPRHGGIFEMADHAKRRASQRGVRMADIRRAIRFGRVIFARGAKLFVIGRKEARDRRVRDLEGLHVVTHPSSGVVLTVYKNREIQA